MRIQVNKSEFARMCYECSKTSSCFGCQLNPFCNTDEVQELDLLCTEKLARICVITHEGETDYE